MQAAARLPSRSIIDKHNLFFTLEYDGDYNRNSSVLQKILPDLRETLIVQLPDLITGQLHIVE